MNEKQIIALVLLVRSGGEDSSHRGTVGSAIVARRGVVLQRGTAAGFSGGDGPFDSVVLSRAVIWAVDGASADRRGAAVERTWPFYSQPAMPMLLRSSPNGYALNLASASAIRLGFI